MAGLRGLLAEGGEAPGPDGISHNELDEAAGRELVRLLRVLLHRDEYRPGGARTEVVSKGIGRGTRTLQIRSVPDRVVERTLLLLLQPFLDTYLPATAIGGRPGRGVPQAMARLAAAVTPGCSVRCLDLANAFDSVPRDRLRAVLALYAPHPRILNLVSRIMGGDVGIGIPQGSSLSTLMLNLYIAHEVEWSLPAALSPRSRHTRYVDDVGLVSPDPEHALTDFDAMEARLRAAGLSVRQFPPPGLLDSTQDGTIEYLGFAVCVDAAAAVRLESTAAHWAEIGSQLDLAHRADDPTAAAGSVLASWAGHLGITAADVAPDKRVSTSGVRTDELVQRLLAAAVSTGHREAGHCDRLRLLVLRAASLFGAATAEAVKGPAPWLPLPLRQTARGGHGPSSGADVTSQYRPKADAAPTPPVEDTIS